MTSTLSGAATPTGISALDEIHLRIDTDGYAIVRDADLGRPADMREHIHRTYFNDTYLRTYDFDVPKDRERARDVIRYEWTESCVDLAEHGTVAISNRDGKAYREFERVTLLDDPYFADWITSALTLVPPHLRQERGTFGVNLFRTHTDVVTKPHRDGEEYILIYVLEHEGSGAQSILYPDGGGAEIHHTLQPGELVIFRDDAFRHTATPLVPPTDGPAHRDVLVCTVNYHDTYDIS